MTTQEKARIESAQLAVTHARENLRELSDIGRPIGDALKPTVAELQIALDLLSEVK